MGVGAGVAWAMAAGDLLAARRVSKTISMRITPLNDGQGRLSNLISAVLILWASRLGVPVSTTHVARGALMGLCPHTPRPAESWIGRILSSGVLALPLAAALGALLLWILRTAA